MDYEVMTKLVSKKRVDKFMQLMTGGDPALYAAFDWFSAQVAKAEVKPFSGFFDLTPALARVLLEVNPDNRKVSESALDKYVHDIMTGQYEVNGEPIIIARTGELNDGQHRCWAVIETGRTIHTNMVFGVERSTRSTIDTGVNKTVGAHLHMQGVKDANHAASIAKLLFLWRTRDRQIHETSGSLRATPKDIQSTYETYASQIDHAILAAGKNGVALYRSKSTVAFCYLLFARATNRATAQEFLDQLLTGAGLNAGDPALAVRNKFINLSNAAMLRPVENKAEAIIRGWNAWRRGDTLSKIQLMGSIPPVEK